MKLFTFGIPDKETGKPATVSDILRYANQHPSEKCWRHTMYHADFFFGEEHECPTDDRKIIDASIDKWVCIDCPSEESRTSTMVIKGKEIRLVKQVMRISCDYPPSNSFLYRNEEPTLTCFARLI